MIRLGFIVVILAVVAFVVCNDRALAQGPVRTTPGAGLVAAITTGGTAVKALTGPANGCYIVNPLTSTDQNIMTAEPLYVDPVTTALVSAHGTTVALAPGDKWPCIPYATTDVSVNAGTDGHRYTVVRW